VLVCPPRPGPGRFRRSFRQLEAAVPLRQAHRSASTAWVPLRAACQGSGWQVKKILVKPGLPVACRCHHHRRRALGSGFKGTALVEKDGSRSCGRRTNTYTPWLPGASPVQPGKIPVELIDCAGAAPIFGGRHRSVFARSLWPQATSSPARRASTRPITAACSKPLAFSSPSAARGPPAGNGPPATGPGAVDRSAAL